MKVYLLGETGFDQRCNTGHEVWDWLKDFGISDEAVASCSHMDEDLSASERIIILAAKRCYKSFAPGLNPNVTKVRDDPKEFIYNILKSGHGSVLEHASATFALEGISRVCTHELVRHRIGVAISQESLRYVKLEDFDIVESPEVEGELGVVKQVIVNCLLRLRGLREKAASFDVKKRMTSAERRIVPMGISTGMVWTANFRALRWVLEQRTNPAAEWEICRLFNAVGDICLSSWSLVFQDFKKVPCEDYPDLFSFVPEFSKV